MVHLGAESLKEFCGMTVLLFKFQLSDLDKLNAIHVTGTKGKVFTLVRLSRCTLTPSYVSYPGFGVCDV